MEGKDNTFFICPSLRYLNEYQLSRDLNLEIPNTISFNGKVKASLLPRLNRMSPEGVAKYMKFACFNDSETQLDNLPDTAFDFVCENDINFTSDPFFELRWVFRKAITHVIDIYLKTNELEGNLD